jgi:hypothetical protein
MKRCPLPDADRIVILFSDLLSKDPDPWAETDVDLTGLLSSRWVARRRCSWLPMATV